MSGIEKNCLINLDMRHKNGRICVWRWHEVKERAATRCVRSTGESVDRQLKAELVRAKREGELVKRCEDE